MNILYFGTVCNMDSYQAMVENCKEKPSVAPIVFETALLNGFKENGAHVEVFSYPMIPAFPKGNHFVFGGKKELLSMGYTCDWLFTMNIPVIKQFSRKLDAKRKLKKWLKENKEDGIVFTYSIPPFLVKDILNLCKQHNVKVIAIIPDLLRDMYMNESNSGVIAKLKQAYLKPALEAQNQYDGYIYLTDAMHEVVAPDKPYIVVEGIANLSDKPTVLEKDSAGTKAVMYAGMLHKKYGVINLLDAFEMVDLEGTELWLFGDGTAREEVQKRAQKNPKIKCFGSVKRETVLEYEQRASLLVNPRNPNEEYTKYSFPSKIIEYMLSGTPFLTTKLEGIPEEYYNYIFCTEGNSKEELAEQIRAIFNQSEAELRAVGERAEGFIRKEKNAKSQTRKMINFMEEVLKFNEN